MTTRLALYARVSSEIQEKEATIESQVAQLKDAAAKQGDVIVQEYRDDGFSGDLLARPALDRLRDDAAHKLFDKVLVLSPDRLARKWFIGEIVAEELKKQGVTIQYLNHKDDGTPESHLMLSIQGAFAQYEKAKMLERIRRGRLHCAKSGRVMLSQPPYGYRYIPKTGQIPGYLEVDPEQAQAVRLIFDSYARGVPVSGVASELKRRGLRASRGASWPRSTIMKILRSETYAGVWHYNKKVSAAPYKIRNQNAVRRRINTTQHVRPRDQWVAVTGVPAIVTRELWEAAQIQLQKSRQFSTRNRHRPYLLAGLLRCGDCGRAVCGSPNNGYTYYRCSGNGSFAGVRLCSTKALNAARVDVLVWDRLKHALLNPRLIAENLSSIQEELNPDVRPDDTEKKQERLKATEVRLLDAYSSGAITLEQLQCQMRKVRDQQEALRMPTGVRSQPAPVKLESLQYTCGLIAQGLDILDSDFEKRQQFVRMIVDRVTLKPGQARITGALPEVAEAHQEPFRTLDAVSLQWRGHKHIIAFELEVAV